MTVESQSMYDPLGVTLKLTLKEIFHDALCNSPYDVGLQLSPKAAGKKIAAGI
jgi:hypothetical protein